MEEDFIDLTAPPQEEPWCSACSMFSDYKRKWTTYPRANLDGGTYSENIEIPHCIECGSTMHYLRSSKQLVRGFLIVAVIFLLLSTLILFLMYDLSIVTLSLWVFCTLVTILISKVPVASRRALATYSLYIEKQKILKTNESTE